MKTTVSYALILWLTGSMLLAGLAVASKGIETITYKIQCVETALERGMR